jgi:hypothetical protein
MTPCAALRLVGVAAFGLWLAACSAERDWTGPPQVGGQPQIVDAIRRYYESNAAEENNACSALSMSSVTQIDVVSDNRDTLVVDVSYFYSNWAHRDSMRCRGFGERQFTLARAPGGYRVTDMTGERRLGARWRIW